MQRLVKTAMIALVGATICSGPSFAGFKLCNQSDEGLSVAIGYNNKEYGWVSEGWWNVDKQKCENILTGELNNRYYYIYAEGDNGGLWAAPKDQDSGFFCIKKGKFTLRNDDFQSKNEIDCESNGATTKQFKTVDTKNAQDFEFDLQ